MSQQDEHSEMEELDLFDSIVRGTATEAAKEHFETRLKVDAGFAERFDLFKRTIQHISDNAQEKGDVDTSELRKRLEDEDRKKEENSD